ncbi:tripartite tricarboxylate transporter TctB family protein [Chelativorans alearense]|uniref:tripartite tricarboxylate transporter TctB family protein n=1 Tax=Chelativorans alearense TaxID=2681495 RepID=UPI0013D82696|nr:tripartite tricarboxylate transporter TctB family protein [Chelativorans alearense]
MRMIFFVVILATGLMYSYLAFTDLDFLTTTGRLGPGFFPRVIGTLMVVFTIWSMIAELRPSAAEGRSDVGGYAGQVALIMSLGVAYVLSLGLVGGIPATVIFLFVTLSVLNRDRLLQNGLVALLVPGAIYVLFDRLLNAAIPEGVLPLPF